MRRSITFLLITILAIAVGYVAGCSNSVKPPPKPVDQAPETELTFAPLNGDTTLFRVHFYWNGWDKDGEVIDFRFAVDGDTSLPMNQWHTTTSKDTVLAFLVDPVQGLKSHSFKIASEDNLHKIDPTPAQRTFSATTIPPTSDITKGPAAFNPIVGPNFTFEWEGIDPDGGETGGRAAVDSFEYQLLLIGGVGDQSGTHPPLPGFQQDRYVNLINQATGPTLPAPYDDWKWIGIHALKQRFRNATPGEYVFAERAVDIAGATERTLHWITNIRHFTVSTANPGPSLTVTSSVLVQPLPPTSGPIDTPRKDIQIFEGETISFSWVANAAAYGGDIVGYTFALDDTSSFPGIDLLRTGATFVPSQLPAGHHFLFVRAIDDGGLVTNAQIPILIVHPSFKDPSNGRNVLYVDDSQAPGAIQNRVGNFPSDVEESNWWVNGIDATHPSLLRQSLGGVPFTEWDTYLAGLDDVLGRKQPLPTDLAHFTTVIWNVDFNNGVASPTALWKTVVGGSYSELAGYLRAGGTLILTGFSFGSNTTDPRTTMYTNGIKGVCITLPPGKDYNLCYFPRLFMGVDGMTSGSAAALRTLGARDFTEAWPTVDGIAAGFDTARVDAGPSGSTSKWITYTGGDKNSNDSPGLPAVDGWLMARNFNCVQNVGAVFRVEENSPIALPIYRYHGARVGILQDGGASPREGMVVGVRCQAHDLGNNPLGGGVVITPGNSAGAMGRMIHLGFPMYFLKDADAVALMTASFNYVNHSPTLP